MKDKQYIEAIEKSKDLLKDIQKRGKDAVGDNAIDFINSLMTPEERAESDLRVSLIGELIKARKDKGISQKKLEELSGVKQPVIARMENGTTSPQIDTLLKVLIPLGKTLAVVPLDAKDRKQLYNLQ